MWTPNASYAIILRVKLDKDPTALGRATTAVGAAGGAVTAVDAHALTCSPSPRWQTMPRTPTCWR